MLSLDIAGIGRGAVLLSLDGELDLASVSLVMSAVDDLTARGETTLVADARGLTFCDAAGLRSFIEADRALEWLAVVPSDHLRRVAALAGIERRLRFFGTVDEALAGRPANGTARRRLPLDGPRPNGRPGPGRDRDRRHPGTDPGPSVP